MFCLLFAFEVIVAQNKANKDRLKNLHKVKQVFQDCLKLEIRKIQGRKALTTLPKHC